MSDHSAKKLSIGLILLGLLAVVLAGGYWLLSRADQIKMQQAAANGMIRYNNSSSKFELYQAGAWVNIATGGATPPAGINTQVQFNSSGAFGASVRIGAKRPARTFSRMWSGVTPSNGGRPVSTW